MKYLNNIHILAFLMAAVPLAGALGSQYFGGLHPCEYCIYQRVPYIAILVIAGLSLAFHTRAGVKWWLYTLLFFITAGLGFYHAGGELGYWKIASDCVADLDFNNLMASLKGAAVVRCDDIQFELFGISMAGWNFIYGLVAGILVLKLK